MAPSAESRREDKTTAWGDSAARGAGTLGAKVFVSIIEAGCPYNLHRYDMSYMI